MQPTTQPEILDVIIIGAGLSGIGAAWHIQTKCPGKTWAIFEARDTIGGTWDLFKYPGIRSDSDMFTLGFSFNPWTNPKAIADGPSILQYIKDTASKFGIDKNIRYNHKIIDANWDDNTQLWTLLVRAHPRVRPDTPNDDAPLQIQCRFLFACSGYYKYDQGYTPNFPGAETFKGPIIHPQQWDTNLNYKNKNVVVIGSGATAITLVPELTKQAKHVTMLQRSPTYIINRPSQDVVANFLRKILPGKVAYQLSRWKNILLALMFFKVSKRWPKGVKKLIQSGLKKELGSTYNQKDFDPTYDPWDQRLCLVPDHDLFTALKTGKAEIVTDTIQNFTPQGIQLKSGAQLPADVIITATGLQLQLLGGLTLRINGAPVQTNTLHSYRGVMLSGIPNFAIAIGYTNASWTLKCDLNCGYVTRILNYMAAHHYTVCTPQFDSAVFTSEPLLNLSSGYIQRAADALPKQGSASPFKVYQNYLRDSFSLKYSNINDRWLQFK